MSENRTERQENKDIHQSSTFYTGVRALLSIGIYASIGAIAGHYLGRWGEEVDRAGRGMSTTLGRWMGGVGMGGLAAYISLRGASEEERVRDDLSKKNAVLEARLQQLEDDHKPKVKVESEQAEHAGKVEALALDKAV